MSDGFKFEWEGRKYAINLGDVTASEWRRIKQETGLKAGAVLRALSGNIDDLDADVMPSLLWIGQKHAGIAAPEFQHEMPVMNFIATLAKLDEPAEGDDPKEDPQPEAEQPST